MVLRLSRQYVGLNIKLDKARFKHPPPADQQVVENGVGCPVEFSAGQKNFQQSSGCRP